MELLFLFMALGLIPAFIARKKGRPMFGWWVYGVLLFPIALVHILLAQSRPDAIVIHLETHRNLGSDERRCPFCAEIILRDAIKCKHCGSTVRAKAK